VAPIELGQRTWLGEYRYGVVLLLTVAVLLFAVSVPASDWSRAVGVGLLGTTLLFVIATSRLQPDQRRAVTLAASVGIGAVCVGAVAGVFSPPVTFVTSGILALATVPALAAGVVRLLRRRGVTIHAVFGALAIYLLVGLLFAFAIGVAAYEGDSFYFAQGTDGTSAERIYFSFTALTTTGFGDLTPAHQFGRGLAVFQMLFGQLYLVTVISILIGNLGRRPRQAEPASPSDLG
jgi:hypothetical protein